MTGMGKPSNQQTWTYDGPNDRWYGSSVTTSGGSSLPMINNLTIIAGIQTIDQSVFQAIGAFEFNPTGTDTMAPSGSTTYTAFFQPIIEVFPTGVTAETKLYNVGLNSYVNNSLLSSSLMVATRLKSDNLSGSLASGSNTYEMHVRITNVGVGINRATCKGAKLFVTWQLICARNFNHGRTDQRIN